MIQNYKAHTYRRDRGEPEFFEERRNDSDTSSLICDDKLSFYRRHKEILGKVNQYSEVEVFLKGRADASSKERVYPLQLIASEGSTAASAPIKASIRLRFSLCGCDYLSKQRRCRNGKVGRLVCRPKTPTSKILAREAPTRQIFGRHLESVPAVMGNFALKVESQVALS